MKEFVLLYSRVHETLWNMQREKEKNYVLSLGFTDEQYKMFRSAFAAIDEDMNDVLDKDELKRAVGMFRASMSNEDINSMFDYIAANNHIGGMAAPPPAEPKRQSTLEKGKAVMDKHHTMWNIDVKVDFVGFLMVMRYLDNRKKYQQLATKLGLPASLLDTLHTEFQALESFAFGGGGGSVTCDEVEKLLAKPRLKLSATEVASLVSALERDLKKPARADVAPRIDFEMFLRMVHALHGIQKEKVDDFLAVLSSETKAAGSAEVRAPNRN
jgi:hypothetical protein